MPETTDSLKLKLFGPVANSAGETLRDAWELVFGRFGTYVETKRMVRRKSLEDFKKTLESKVNEIPSDRLCDPPLSIIGPALDASKYYFEEEKIREMFASVIAASMDSHTSPFIHPSFPVIIQQLSSLDAQNLEYFSNGSLLPLCEYQIRIPKGEITDEIDRLICPFHVIYTNVFLSNPQSTDILQNAMSIASLAKLGLISVSYETHIDDSYYQPFEKTTEYTNLQSKCDKTLGEFPYIQYGSAHLSPLGTNLCKICFPDND